MSPPESPRRIMLNAMPSRRPLTTARKVGRNGLSADQLSYETNLTPKYRFTYSVARKCSQIKQLLLPAF